MPPMPDPGNIYNRDFSHVNNPHESRKRPRDDDIIHQMPQTVSVGPKTVVNVRFQN